MIAARFDDLARGSERSFRFTEPLGELIASSVEDVPTVLAGAEAEARRGRWLAGFVAYEAAPGLDPALAVRPADEGPFRDLPLAWFGIFRGRERGEPPQPRLIPVEAGAIVGEAGAIVGEAGAPRWAPSVGRKRYVSTVERIRELIASGQTYQVNHTLRMRADLDGTVDPDRVYADLLLAQRGGFGAYLATGRFRVLSASPELFFRWEDGRITTRPMKGTARRGRWPAEDALVAERLRASAKDRAENAMIVDLLRNDLGRIAIPGSVVVDPLFDVERYETVWQMTSTVSADVPDRTRLVDVFRALFPSGSVTGAPKVASMRAIAELEGSRRGVYTGAVGYLAPPGAGEPRANFGVAIRTIQVEESARVAEYGVGAGITFGSSGDAEYDEVEAKSRVLVERRPAFELFETLAWDPAEGYRHLDEHIARLEGSAGYFGFALDRGALLETLEKTAADEDAPIRVRVALARDGRISIETASLPARAGGRVRLAVVERPPVDPDDVWLFHKTTNRAVYEHRRALRPDADDVLLVNTAGRVTESTIANLVVRIDGAWWTPPIADGLLAGTYRAVLMRRGEVRERSLSLKEVRAAEDAALISSVRGWRAADLID